MYDLDGPEPDPVPQPPFCLLIDGHFECRLCTCSPTDQYSCYEFPRPVHGPDATPLQRTDATLDCVERRRRLREIDRRTFVQSRQRMGWLVDAARVSKLVADGNTDLAPVFWIRLCGILNELYDKLLKNHTLAVLTGAKPYSDIVEFLGAIESLAASFSDDERIYIQYRRDVECHPVQDNHASDGFNHKLLAKEARIGLEEFRAAVGRVVARAPSEVALAQMFAERCKLALADLERRGERIYG
jgi:hypothetical protein